MYPVPAAKLALKAILDARPAWNAVDLRDEQPTEEADVTRDAFWFGDTQIPADAWAAGGKTRAVTFELGFVLNIIREGDTPRSGEDAMWALLQDLIAAIQADPTLSGSVQAVEDVTGTQANHPHPNAWRAVFTGSIECRSNFY